MKPHDKSHNSIGQMLTASCDKRSHIEIGQMLTVGCSWLQTIK